MTGFVSLERLLPRLTDEDRATLAARWGLPEASPQAIRERLKDTAWVAATWRNLPPVAQKAIQTWIRRRGVWPAWVSCDTELKAGLWALEEHGWLFVLHDGYYQYPVWPWEFMPLALDSLWDIPWARLKGHSGSRPSPTGEPWTPVWQNIFEILSFCRQEPLLLTTEGRPYRRQAMKLAKRLVVPPAQSHIPEEEWVRLHVWVIERLHFVRFEDDPARLLVDEDRVSRFFDQSPAEIWGALSELVLEPGQTYGPHLLLFSLAQLLPPDETLQLEAAAHWMKSARVFDGPGGDVKTFGHILSLLILLQLIEVTGPNEIRLHDSAYAWSHGLFVPEEAQSVVVQATGELFLPPETPFRDRNTIDRWATLVKSDRMTVYRLDADSIQRAVRQNYPQNQVVEDLHRISRTGVPDNLLVNLHDWYRLAVRHRIYEVTVIHSEDAGESRTLETALGAEVVGRLSPTDLIIRADRVKEILKRLKRAGIPVMPDILRPSQPRAAFAGSPEDPVTPYRLQVGGLPTKTGPTPQRQNDELEQRIQLHIQRQTPFEMTFLMPGESQVRRAIVMAVGLTGGVVDVYLAGQQRPHRIPVGQILAVESHYAD